jgi:hypothetical protein
MSNRRGFLKATGLASLGLANGSLLQGHVSQPDSSQPHVQRFNMSGYAAAKVDKVRIGIIGLGNRGPSHVNTMCCIEGVEIRALCDLRPERVHMVRRMLEGTPHRPTLYSGDADQWMRLCEQEDIDLVIVTTPYYMHAPMAVFAMEHGKHVASEVPAAATIEQCWKLVETAERTRKHCMMLENYAYNFFQLLTLNMARQGFFGEIVHADCAYNTSKMGNNFSKAVYWDMWWLKLYGSKRGNIYPTHGLGPVSQIMDINRGDRFDYLVSMESDDFMMRAKAEKLAADDAFFKPFADMVYRGNMNTTTIRTVRGRTIMLQHDATSPRGPHTMIHAITGTKALAQEYPYPPRISRDLNGWLPQKDYNALVKEFTPTLIKRMGDLSKKIGGHGGGDLLECWRLIDCLRNGLPLDQDVYDAASWSSIVPLSQQSVLNRSSSVDVPDFTVGAWRSNQPNMDIMLCRGGTTKVLRAM